MSKTFFKRQNFWRDQMADRTSDVLNRAVNNANNTRTFNLGGTRKQLPRQIPVGSFNAPFGANSGFESTNREIKGSGANYPVREGHLLSNRLLQQRGKQLEALQEIKSGILEPPKTEERAEVDETQKQSIELLMSNIMESSTAGKLDTLPLEELRKLVNAIVRHGLSLDGGTLERYKQILREVMLEIVAYHQEKDLLYSQRTDPTLTQAQKLAVERSGSYNYKNYEKALPVFNLIYKAYNLIVALIKNVNMGESDRELNFKAQAKKILEARPLKSVDISKRLMAEGILSGQERTRDQTGELPKPPAPKAYSQRRGELQQKLLRLTDAERREYMDAVDELRGRPFTQSGYESRRDYYDVVGNRFRTTDDLRAEIADMPIQQDPRDMPTLEDLAMDLDTWLAEEGEEEEGEGLRQGRTGRMVMIPRSRITNPEALERGAFGEGKRHKTYEEQHSRDNGLFRTAGREEHRRIRAEGRPHAEINFVDDFMFDNID